MRHSPTFSASRAIRLAMCGCTACDHHEECCGEARELTRVTVGDAEVTLSVDVLDHHRPLIPRVRSRLERAAPVPGLPLNKAVSHPT